MKGSQTLIRNLIFSLSIIEINYIIIYTTLLNYIYH